MRKIVFLFGCVIFVSAIGQQIKPEWGHKRGSSYFDSGKLPARTCIGVTGLAVGASIEIDLIAKI